jgi:hypothetical protein
MVRLGSLSDQMTPVLSDLGAVAPDVNRLVRETGPFAAAADPALQRLGDATVVGRQALVKARPIVQDLARFASAARPLSANLQSLTTSLRDTGGIERALDYIFFQVAAINGFDSVGHYLRAGLLVNACSQYAISSSADCSANFQDQGTDSGSASGASASASAAATPATTVKGYADTRRSPDLRRLDASLHGLDPDTAVPQGAAAQQSAPQPAQPAAPAAAGQPAAPMHATPAPTATAQPAAVRAPASADAPAADPATGALLDYLIGS